MYRKVLATMLLLGALSGCSKELGTCGPNGECGAGGVCDVARNLCYTVVEAELDGGACTPACAPYEACTSRGCVPRYVALTVTPGDGGVVGAGAVAVRAELVLQPGAAANFPETLDFRVVRSDGGVGGTLTAGPRTAGVYPAQWTPPGDGVFLLTAAYPQSGGPSTTVHLTADTTPPTFTVTVPTADAGAVAGGTSYADPSLPTAWRRDQVVPVQIRTNESNLEPGSVLVVLRGTDGGAAPEVSVSPFASGESCDASFCGVAQVPLWEPPFNSFRGSMTLEVRGRDRVGNAGTSLGNVSVTRWKWSYGIAGPNNIVTAAPVIGHSGSLYIGTTNADDNDGQFIALSSEGRVLWSADGGAVLASPTVGEIQDGGFERVYAAHKKGAVSRVGFYASSDGGFVTVCPDFSNVAVRVEASLALAQLSVGSASETVYGVYAGRSGGTLFAARPDILDEPLLQCPSLTGVGDVSAPSTMLASGDSVVFGTNSGSLKSYALTASGSWPTTGAKWTQALGLTPTSLGAAQGRVWGGSQAGLGSQLFSAPLDGGTAPTLLSTSSPAWNLSIGNQGSGVVALGLNNSNLFVADTADGGTRNVDTAVNMTPEIIKGAPVWGAGDYVYTAGSTSGVIQARRPLESVVWQFEPGAPIEASMNLDCSRAADGGVVSGRPGVLYAVTRGGKVYSIVVDSRGLDTLAPWPKYQHDARNTGNPATPISSCP